MTNKCLNISDDFPMIFSGLLDTSLAGIHKVLLVAKVGKVQIGRKKAKYGINQNRIQMLL